MDDYDFENKFNQYIEESSYNFSLADKFFLSKIKSDLILLIETIKNQLNYTQLTKTMYEKEIFISINERLGIRFKGIIDKFSINSDRSFIKSNQHTEVESIDFRNCNIIKLVIHKFNHRMLV